MIYYLQDIKFYSV